jgi:hypothetical protein
LNLIDSNDEGATGVGTSQEHFLARTPFDGPEVEAYHAAALKGETMPRTIKRKNKKRGSLAEPKAWLKAAPEGDIWAGYDRTTALKMFRETAGALKGIHVEARIAALYRAREEGTRPTNPS